MSSQNKKDQQRMGVLVPDGSPDTERQIEETQALLRDTRALLDKITHGNDKTRRHIEELKESLEDDLRRLESERDGRGESEN